MASPVPALLARVLLARPRRVPAGVALPLLAALAFAPALAGPFVLDDRLLVLENPHFGSPGSALRLFAEPVAARLPGGMENVYYRPLSFLTLWVDLRLWGGSPFGFHLTSLLLHAGSSLLALRLARRVLGGEAAPWAAAFWAVLPVQAEAVSYIAARHDVLFLLLYLLALEAYTGGRGALRGGLFVLAAAASFLSKEMAVSLPVAAGLHAILLEERPRRGRDLLARLLPPALALAGCLAVRLLVHARASPGEGTLRVDPVLLGSVGWHYLGILASPLSYSVERSRDVIPSGAQALAFTLIAAGGLVLLARAALRREPERRRLILFGVLWAGASYLPVSNLIPFYSVCADRYLYLPLLPCVLALAAAAAPFPRPELLRAGAAGLLLAFAGLCAFRAGFFTSEKRLYQTSLDASPSSPLLHNNLGRVLKEEGDSPGAAREFRKALELAPGYFEPCFNLGVVSREHGDPTAAEELLRACVEARPESAEAWFQWGLAALASFRFGEAAARLRVADRLEPGELAIRYHLAAALFQGGWRDEARPILEELARSHPEHRLTRILLSRLRE